MPDGSPSVTGSVMFGIEMFPGVPSSSDVIDSSVPMPFSVVGVPSFVSFAPGMMSCTVALS